MTKVSCRTALLATTILAGSLGAAKAADTIITYTGPNNGAWTTGGNWSNGAGPTSASGVADFINSDTVSVSGASGAQGLESSAAATISLNNSTLTISDTFTGGSYAFTGSLNGSGAISFGGVGSTGTQIFSGAVTGSLGLTVAGGTLVLSGADTYSGGTTISTGGTLQIGANGTAGSITSWSVTDNGALVFDLAGPQIFSAQISGTGSLAQQGTGTLTLSGYSTYSGATTINSGTLALSGSGSITSSSVVDSGTFDISASNGASIQSLSGAGGVTLGANTLTLSKASGTYSGAMNGTGGLTLSGGTETLSGTNTYNGATAINGGTLQIAGSGSLGSGSYAGAITDNGTLEYSSSAAQTLSGAIVGSGGLTKDASGSMLTLTGTNTYSGATTIAAGTLQIAGSGSLSGGAITDNGTFEYSSSAAQTFWGAISGTGGLMDTGTGTLTLQAANIYAGATLIGGGATLAVTAAGSIADSIGVTNNGTLTFAGLSTGTATITTLSGSGVVTLPWKSLTLSNANGTFSGAISGSGGLTLSGGTETLSGVNSYSGGTTINGGTLVAAGPGALQGAVTLNGGALETTVGQTISGLTAASGGTGAINVQGGTLTVGGGAPSLYLSGLTLASGASLALPAGSGAITIEGGNGIVGDYSNANATASNKVAGITGATAVNAYAGVADTAATVAFGNVHVGVANTAQLAITNGSIASGSTNVEIRGWVTQQSGSTVSIANPTFAVAPQSFADVAVGWTPMAAGSLSGQTLTVVNDFSNLGNLSASVTGAAYNYAAANTLTTPISYGNVHVGGTDSTTLSIKNTAPSSSYTEGLDAAFIGTTGSATGSGSISLLSGQSANNTSMAVGLDTSTAGAKSGTATVGFTSDGTGTSGLGDTPLASQTLTLSGAVYGYAVGSAASTPIALGNVHVGGADSQTLTVSNAAPGGGYYEGLDAAFGPAPTGLTTSGSITNLAANSSDRSSMSVGLNTGAAGAKSGTVTLNYTSDGTIDGLASSGAGSQSISVTGNVYAYAAATPSTTSVNLGAFHVGSNPASQSFTVQNTGVGPSGYVEDLDVGAATSGGFSSSSVNEITQGASGTVNVSLSGGALGVNNGALALGLTSNGTVNGASNGLGATTLTGQSVSVTATGYHYANPEMTKLGGAGTLTGSGDSYTLSFGSVSTGNTVTFDLGVLNGYYLDDPNGKYTDALGGSFSGSGAFTLTGFGDLSGVAAGESYDAGAISYTVASTGPWGPITETLWLDPISQNPYLTAANLSPIELTITLNAVPESSTWAMLALGLCGLGFAGFRRARRDQRAIEV